MSKKKKGGGRTATSFDARTFWETAGPRAWTCESCTPAPRSLARGQCSLGAAEPRAAPSACVRPTRQLRHLCSCGHWGICSLRRGRAHPHGALAFAAAPTDTGPKGRTFSSYFETGRFEGWCLQKPFNKSEIWRKHQEPADCPPLISQRAPAGPFVGPQESASLPRGGGWGRDRGGGGFRKF